MFPDGGPLALRLTFSDGLPFSLGKFSHRFFLKQLKA